MGTMSKTKARGGDSMRWSTVNTHGDDEPGIKRWPKNDGPQPSLDSLPHFTHESKLFPPDLSSRIFTNIHFLPHIAKEEGQDAPRGRIEGGWRSGFYYPWTELELGK